MVEIFGRTADRARMGWWILVVALAAAMAFVVHAVVGVAVLGVFGYYATRPIYERVAERIGSDGIAATLTLLVVTLPVVVLVFYTGFELFRALQSWLGSGVTVPVLEGVFGSFSGDGAAGVRSLLRNPRQLVTDPGGSVQRLLQVGRQAAAALFSGLLVLALALALAFFLLRNDDDFAAGLTELFGGRDTTAHAYARAVDSDLESVFFGNFVFAAVMAVIAAAAYLVTNYLAPAGLGVPIPLALAALTGVASLIPVVVGKVVYLPVVAYLGLQAYGTGGSGSLAFVAGVLVAYVLVLDLLPQGFIQPYVTGGQVNVTVLLFGYIVGPMVFGWYGFFLLPILFVAVLEAVRFVLPELVHGRPLTPTTSMGESLGADVTGGGTTAGDSDAGAATDDS